MYNAGKPLNLRLYCAIIPSLPSILLAAHYFGLKKKGASNHFKSFQLDAK